jgi:tRNA modification GTPase
MNENDTIAAISTPFGTGGIGIIRISGEKAFEIAKRIFKGRKTVEKLKSHTINYGKIVDYKNNIIIDEILLTKMNSPRTFTKEDIVEINCHGGIVILKRILELVLREGARLANPGEFTKRAFLNGRIDLAQAEAIIDLINAKTLKSSEIALKQLEGGLSLKIKELKDELIKLIAHIEAVLDYPEENIDEITEIEMVNSLTFIKDRLKSMLLDFKKGKIFKEGVKAVIIGKPNVGKSSLLNNLAGYDRAIVTNIPGTTRDILEEYINIEGIPLRVLDTAGIRETKDEVEIIGVEKTMKAVESADLIILMVDATLDFQQEDVRIFKIVNKFKDKKSIILLNKIDLVKKNDNRSLKTGLENSLRKLDINGICTLLGIKKTSVIETSMKNLIGIDKLKSEILRMFIGGEIDKDNETLIVNVRHGNLIESALKSINDAIKGYNESIPFDILTIDIRNAAQFLGEITGESVNDEILNQIFSRFCIGK